MKQLLLLLGCCTWATPGFGQGSPLVDRNPLTWVGYVGDQPVTAKWVVHTELQWRRANWGRTAQQLEIFLGAERTLTRRLKAAGGAAYAQTHRYGAYPAVADRPAPERRTYQELTLKSPWQRLVLTHRLRLEQRWLGARAANGQGRVQEWKFQQRVRYQLAGLLPLGGPVLANHGWYLNAYDELFVSVGRNAGADAFSENRLAGGPGYQLTPLARVELNYLRQVSRHARPDPASGREVVEVNQGIQLMLFYSLDFTRRRDQ